MQLVERRVRLGRGVSTVEVLASGCLHFGNSGTQEHQIRKMVEYIAAAPNRRLILLGDVTDGISVSDSRFNPREVAPWLATADLSNRILLEAERAIQFLSPIKDRIDGIIEGNHEGGCRRRSQVDIHRVLYNGLGVESLGLMAFLKYTFVGRDRGEAEPLVFYCEHGSGGAGMVGTVMNKLIKRAKDFTSSDVVLGSHHHRSGGTTAETVDYDAVAHRLRYKSTLVVTVGTFLNYHTSGRETYGEQFAMSPHGIGPAKIIVRPWAKDGERVGYSFPYTV